MPDSPPRRRRLLIGLLAAAALALLPITWVLAHVLSEPGPPMWTEADLPAPPPPGENGWTLVANERFGSVRTHRLREMLDRDRSLAERAHVLEADSDDVAIEARTRRDEVTRARRLLERPRFVIDCPRSITASCDELQAMLAADLILVDAVDHADHGRWDAATREVGELAARALDGLRESDALIEAGVMAVALERALGLGEVLLESAPEPPPPEATARLAEVARALRDEGAPRPTTAVRGEYVTMRDGFDLLEREAGSSWTLAGGATTERLDAHFEALERYAAGDGPAPPPLERGPLWWAYNPAGDLLLETVTMGGTGPVDAVVTPSERAEAVAGRLAERLAR